MSDDFYRSFEEKYRGSRELILSRLDIYRPFISPLQAFYPASPAVDLGCGRGEWLELLLSEGFSPLGIDQDEEMLRDCRGLNLPAQQGDAVSFLSTLPEESQAVVSAFHMVEHLSFEQLRVVVSEALRVLKPGGLLIMETPNPENIMVATRKFYIDPTHQRPIPPELLSFLPEYYGFARIKTIRLQESKCLMQHSTALTLQNVLEGVSPDYAVVAQKSGAETIFKAVDAAFAGEYGLSMETLVTRYHAQSEAASQQAIERATQSEATSQQAIERAAQSEATSRQTEKALNAIYASRSWRITAPLRWVGNVVRWFVRGSFAWLTFAPMSRPRRVVRKACIHLKLFVSARPHLKAFTLRWLSLFPALKERLKRVGSQSQPDLHPFQQAAACVSPAGVTVTIEGPEQLSPRARRIYNDLKAAIEQRRKEQG